jgi:uncharacterized membrane protein
MDYRLSWLSTLIVVAIALVIGVLSALVIRDGILRNLWAVIMSLAFTAAAIAAVFFEYSWAFTDAARLLAQEIAVGTALTGIVYSLRAPR